MNQEVLKPFFILSINAPNLKTGVTIENGLHMSIITRGTPLQRNLRSDS